jgi:hypothetical protein
MVVLSRHFISIDLALNDPSFAQIVARLQAKASQVRFDYIIKPKLRLGQTVADRPNLMIRGNVAVSELILGRGDKFEASATSKRDPVDMPGTRLGPAKIFEPHEDRSKRNHRGQYKLNITDPEYKIYNILASQLRSYCEHMQTEHSDVTGRLYLYTEHSIYLMRQISFFWIFMRSKELGRKRPDQLPPDHYI